LAALRINLSRREYVYISTNRNLQRVESVTANGLSNEVPAIHVHLVEILLVLDLSSGDELGIVGPRLHAAVFEKP